MDSRKMSLQLLQRVDSNSEAQTLQLNIVGDCDEITKLFDEVGGDFLYKHTPYPGLNVRWTKAKEPPDLQIHANLLGTTRRWLKCVLNILK